MARTIGVWTNFDMGHGIPKFELDYFFAPRPDGAFDLCDDSQLAGVIHRFKLDEARNG